MVGAFADPAPDVPLNQPIGPHRRFVWARSELATFKRIKNALGGTVNDVVLAVVTGALRDWLHGRGIRTEGLELRALVPVSIRSEDERGNLGNRIAAMRGPLPVYVEDPVRRLRVVTEGMEGLKRSKQALGAEVISRFNDFAPPTLLAQASRVNFSTRLFNMIVTNVPGPQVPLYVLGREMEEIFPVAFLPQNHVLAVAIMSYNGRICFGLLADYDAVEDVDVIADGHLRLAGGARGGGLGRRPGLTRVGSLGFAHGLPRRPLHRRPDRRALRDHPDRAADRPLADPGPAARRRPARLAAAAPPGPRRLARASTRRSPQRRFPGKEVADGLLIAIGGTLLLTPGFLTDIVGAIFLIPPTRALVRRLLRGWADRRFVVVGGPAGAAYGAATGGRGRYARAGPGPNGARPRLRLRGNRRGDRGRRPAAAGRLSRPFGDRPPRPADDRA